MRIITGSARGTRLRSIDGNDVRPTGERVKEAVFSALHFDIEGRRVLDLFAGCGQLGIEALSRGAESATFTDSSQHCIDIIRNNLSAAHLENRAAVIKKDFKFFLQTTAEKFDIAFVDPPYHAGLYKDAISGLPSVMSKHGIIVCEHPFDVEVPNTAGDFAVSKVYRYGKVLVSFYRRKEEAL